MEIPIFRRAQADDLTELLRLYRLLQPEDPPLRSDDGSVLAHWATMLSDDRLQVWVADLGGVLIATCVLSVIPNLTRAMKPYGLIENVVTDPSYRRRGYGRQVLHAALSEAWRKGCYKVMLLTGRKTGDVLRFYEQSGFLRDIKTGFIAYPPQSAK